VNPGHSESERYSCANKISLVKMKTRCAYPSAAVVVAACDTLVLHSRTYEYPSKTPYMKANDRHARVIEYPIKGSTLFDWSWVL
jgi:hypothetical protein